MLKQMFRQPHYRQLSLECTRQKFNLYTFLLLELMEKLLCTAAAIAECSHVKHMKPSSLSCSIQQTNPKAIFYTFAFYMSSTRQRFQLLVCGIKNEPKKRDSSRHTVLFSGSLFREMKNQTKQGFKNYFNKKLLRHHFLCDVNRFVCCNHPDEVGRNDSFPRWVKWPGKAT